MSEYKHVGMGRDLAGGFFKEEDGVRVYACVKCGSPATTFNVFAHGRADQDGNLTETPQERVPVCDEHDLKSQMKNLFSKMAKG